MISILKGSIMITDKIDFIRDILMDNPGNFKVVTLDEDGIIPLESKDVLCGTCLLPPMDALIAEQDGDMEMYDAIYNDHFADQYPYEFMVALISFLFRNGNLIFYIPDTNSMTCMKFKQIIYKLFGIYIGTLGIDQYQYDLTCIPMWLNMIYRVNVMDYREFLYYYPNDAVIQPDIMNKIVIEMNPYGETYEEKAKYVLDFRTKIKSNIKLVCPLFSVIR